MDNLKYQVFPSQNLSKTDNAATIEHTKNLISYRTISSDITCSEKWHRENFSKIREIKYSKNTIITQELTWKSPKSKKNQRIILCENFYNTHTFLSNTPWPHDPNTPTLFKVNIWSTSHNILRQEYKGKKKVIYKLKVYADWNKGLGSIYTLGLPLPLQTWVMWDLFQDILFQSTPTTGYHYYLNNVNCTHFTWISCRFIHRLPLKMIRKI